MRKDFSRRHRSIAHPKRSRSANYGYMIIVIFLARSIPKGCVCVCAHPINCQAGKTVVAGLNAHIHIYTHTEQLCGPHTHTCILFRVWCGPPNVFVRTGFPPQSFAALWVMKWRWCWNMWSRPHAKPYTHARAKYAAQRAAGATAARSVDSALSSRRGCALRRDANAMWRVRRHQAFVVLSLLLTRCRWACWCR